MSLILINVTVQARKRFLWDQNFLLTVYGNIFRSVNKFSVVYLNKSRTTDMFGS